MTDSYTIQQRVEQRCNILLTGLGNVQKVLGVDVEGVLRKEDSEQFDARRQLLRVEKQAIRDKELNEKSEQSYVDSIRDMVHENLLEQFKERLQDKDTIFYKILGYDDGLTALLDALTVRASSISKIEPLAAEVPWLYDDLIKMINQPKYRKTDARGKVVTVESLRVALSFLGMENLKLVVPAMAFRRWIPQITDPYPDIKSRLWECALATALSCRKIAEHSKVDPGQAFTLGLFHELGKLVVTRLYFRLFDEVQRAALIEAHNDRKREEHTALTKIEPSADYLIFLLESFAAQISAELITRMGFKRLFIATAIHEYAERKPLAQCSPMARVLHQGIAYARYRILKGHKLITMDEAKEYLREVAMPSGALSALKATDLRSLNLTFDEN
ncbi:HDOD domain-containing protein [Aestuariibacter halophilus]|uniref:HDOD domain-containing protein n=1 Tax=Fluctibacter halophilus TaxID=226011 RepID=A0ABS8G9Y0_9ALTE|nr:HDOD domain-containing protein [Aestuariibacter halophilus]MCC2617392.1 HDOD domain-containing protein [Aestuariibacter halophilus]